VRRIGFRGRLFLILFVFALVPALAMSLVWIGANEFVLPMMSQSAGWDSAAATGSRALDVARKRQLSRADSIVIAQHEQSLSDNLLQSKRAGEFFRRLGRLLGVGALLALAVLLIVASRVAGHLSRSLSRPLQELVGWTEHIARGEPVPDEPAVRGAPEFEVLRGRMRDMSAELEHGRKVALEAERVSAMRETARQVAHELKNPLTPIRFAVERLRRVNSPELRESIDVLTVESARLEELARSFSQFGRLPEGPVAPVDLGELARYTARSSVPTQTTVEVTVDPEVPLIQGHYEALSRALSNVVLNAVEACKDGGSIAVDVSRVARNGTAAVALTVRDTGCGISAERIAKIWEPYVTYKPGGTGLGLAIARQTVLAHEGEVTAESQPGHGTTIRFILPVRKSGESAPPSSPST
jgi:two-component system nitrogen regulation sensor histidine kinase NtrY